MKISKIKKIIYIIAFSALLLLAGCGSGTGTESSYMSITIPGNLNTLDSTQAYSVSSFETLENCMEGLLQVDKDGNLIPGIAESYEVSDDGLTYTFHLRDCTWSNGTKVTADDFVFAWQKLITSQGSYSSFLGDVACVKNAAGLADGTLDDINSLGVYAADDSTLVVELEIPVVFFDQLMSFGALYPINREFYNSIEEGCYGTSPDTFITDGAFMLENYTPGCTTVVLQKNPLYWNSANVKLEGFKEIVVTSTDVAIEAFKAGAVDETSLGGSGIATVNKDKALKDRLLYDETSTISYIVMNETGSNKCLGNAEFRKALEQAFDKDSIVNEVMKGSGVPAYRLISENFAISSLTGEDFGEDPDLYREGSDYDVQSAREHLENAKKELGQDKFTVKLSYTSGDNMVQLIKSQIEKNLPDVTVNLVKFKSGEFMAAAADGTLEMHLTGWVPDYSDPISILSLFESENPFNYSNWHNSEFDQLCYDCTKGKYIHDYEARWEALKEMEKLLMEDTAVIPLYTNVDVYLLSDRVSGFWETSGGLRVLRDVELNN